MRATLLIARREYLSYVATWGFWLSLLGVPFFAAIGGLIPILIQSSQPVRYYAVIDETDQGLDRVVEQTLLERRRARVRAAIATMARELGGDETARTALNIFDEDPAGTSQAEAALEAVGLSDAGAALEAGRARTVLVDAPAQTIEALRPYLSADQTIDTSEGPKGLFAVFIIREQSGQNLEMLYLSANLTDAGLRSDVHNILSAHMREQALMAEGLEPDEIDAILALRPAVTNLDVRGDASDADGMDEVTFADRAPFFVAVGLGFILWTAVFSIVNMLLTSLVEEKGGKIIELLLSTVRFHDILAGKLIGAAALSLTLFAIWGGVVVLLSTLFGAALASIDPDLLTLLLAVFDPGLLMASLFFFTVGYVMYGAIFLAMGSLCDTLQDAQTLMGPVIWILIVPMVIMTFSVQAIDSIMVQIASWIPLWTPFVMMVRLPDDPPLWELVSASALMMATTVLVMWGASVIFRQGALRQADADSVRKWFRLGRKKT